MYLPQNDWRFSVENKIALSTPMNILTIATRTRGFTLIELLVVIAIVAVLSVVVVLALNPAELLRQARDSNRISDLSNLKSALNFYSTDVSNNAAYSLGNGGNCYVDQGPNNATVQAAPFIAGCGVTGFTARFITGAAMTVITNNLYNPTSTANLKDIVGGGWIPVNFTKISSGAPLSALPVDPAPSTANNLFYAYRPGGNGVVCTTGSSCTTYEINAHMESTKYKNGGAGDVESTDGGNNLSLYEAGTYPGLNL